MKFSNKSSGGPAKAAVISSGLMGIASCLICDVVSYFIKEQRQGESIAPGSCRTGCPVYETKNRAAF